MGWVGEVPPVSTQHLCTGSVCLMHESDQLNQISKKFIKVYICAYWHTAVLMEGYIRLARDYLGMYSSPNRKCVSKTRVGYRVGQGLHFRLFQKQCGGGL